MNEIAATIKHRFPLAAFLLLMWEREELDEHNLNKTDHYIRFRESARTSMEGIPSVMG